MPAALWKTKMSNVKKAVRANIPTLSKLLIDNVNGPSQLESPLAAQTAHILKDNNCTAPPLDAFDGAKETSHQIAYGAVV